MATSILEHIPDSYDFISQDIKTDENVHHFITTALMTYSANQRLDEFWTSIYTLNTEYEESEITSKETINIIIDTMLEVDFNTEEEIVDSLQKILFKSELNVA